MIKWVFIIFRVRTSARIITASTAVVNYLIIITAAANRRFAVSGGAVVVSKFRFPFDVYFKFDKFVFKIATERQAAGTLAETASVR